MLAALSRSAFVHVVLALSLASNALAQVGDFDKCFPPEEPPQVSPGQWIGDFKLKFAVTMDDMVMNSAVAGNLDFRINSDSTSGAGKSAASINNIVKGGSDSFTVAGTGVTRGLQYLIRVMAAGSVFKGLSLMDTPDGPVMDLTATVNGPEVRGDAKAVTTRKTTKGDARMETPDFKKEIQMNGPGTGTRDFDELKDYDDIQFKAFLLPLDRITCGTMDGHIDTDNTKIFRDIRAESFGLEVGVNTWTAKHEKYDPAFEATVQELINTPLPEFPSDAFIAAFESRIAALGHPQMMSDYQECVMNGLNQTRIKMHLQRMRHYVDLAKSPSDFTIARSLQSQLMQKWGVSGECGIFVRLETKLTKMLQDIVSEILSRPHTWQELAPYKSASDQGTLGPELGQRFDTALGVAMGVQP